MVPHRALQVLCAGALVAGASAGTVAHSAVQSLLRRGERPWPIAAQESFPGALPAIVHGKERLGSSRYAVGTIDDFALRDSSRNKEVHVRISYPEAKGSFPVVLFSHGYGGSKNGYRALTRYWAARGYVTVQPSHNDAERSRRLGSARPRHNVPA